MGIFEIMGPAMIGPSSSHTAGAARIGRMAALLFAEKIDKAVVKLHGSFADTAVGHGTDKAIIGGLLGFKPDDERLRDSFSQAEKSGMDYSIQEVKLRDVHPNTALIELYNQAADKSISVLASSIGGGSIEVREINGSAVKLTGRLPTLWIRHKDRPGEIALITSVLGKHQINIAFMQVYRNRRGDIGSSILELDQKPPQAVLDELEKCKDIYQLRYLPAL
ncbi:L-serine ammonia-lyase, iron-sulfur-dependent subunit beta [Halanaerobium hydrogeniformans]|uniref:L-serine deaminase n=1 Tax=Halanaerobium hydrogeniformans TaxID=656519 RepID=E4RPR7_HALHG|nr:L-serine ammonia-lyase, iron-sulfur-dependent subunit beta [Halanaerobium hydrogeniformans]ADQ13951.1 L-serine dehydratase, iron-sulfur-dependent, beta subunit [Halanaerobium hydrogeniformans]